MASHTILQFSPSKRSPRSAALPSSLRPIRPSPEKKSLPCTTVIMSPRLLPTVSETGSPRKQREGNKTKPELISQFNVQLDADNHELQKTLSVTKRIELSYSLVENGRATTPPRGGFSELLKLFPTTFGVEVCPPFLIIRVRKLPPKPWPFTVGGLPIHFTTSDWDSYFDYGEGGRGKKVLESFDLQNKDDFSEDILKQAVAVFRDLNIKIRDIVWFAGFWQVTIPDGTELKDVPSFIASHRAYYKFTSEVPDPDQSALRSKVPEGVEYDDTFYATSPNAILRPGIMLSSSIKTATKNGKTEELFKTTTSGLLVADRRGEIFITVATHGFEEDGLVYHPNPHKGVLIGRIVQSLPGTYISLVKLNPGLRYVNETFGTAEDPTGVRASGFSPGIPPHLRAFDSLYMDNPFSGRCEGIVLGLGARIPEEGDKEYVIHQWHVFENGNQPADGSCGSAILDSEDRVVSVFRFKMANSSQCFGVSATELQSYGYEICRGVHTF